MEIQLVLPLLLVEMVTVVTSTSSPVTYELIWERNILRENESVILTCRDHETADKLNIQSVTFWLNRSSEYNQDLREREDFGTVEAISCCSIKFSLIPNLEGYYTCGKYSRNGGVQESFPQTLTCKPSTRVHSKYSLEIPSIACAG